MSDGTSATIFGAIFAHLAESATEDATLEFAEWLFGQMGEYDFHPRQMYVDDDLEALCLAKQVRDEDGEIRTAYHGGRLWDLDEIDPDELEE